MALIEVHKSSLCGEATERCCAGKADDDAEPCLDSVRGVYISVDRGHCCDASIRFIEPRSNCRISPISS